MKYTNCIKCGKPVSKGCKKGYCNSCRDRSGVNNPFYGKHHTKETIDKTRPKNVEASKLLWQNPDYRKKVIKGVSKPRREGFGEEQSKRVTQWYIDNPEQKTIRRNTMKQSWIDGKIEPNIHSINESKYEVELRYSIEKGLPEQYKITKKTIRIDNQWMYPDIIINDKFIIEFYGNYWHADPKIYKKNDIVHHRETASSIWKRDKKRLDLLRKNGYNVYVVWQDEYLNDKELVVNNLLLEIIKSGKDKIN